MKPVTEEWVGKAHGDMSVAEWEMKAREPVYDAVCFHAQQCVEKLLKAIIVEKGVGFPYTHDLIKLWEEAEPGPPVPDDLKRKLTFLSTFAIAFRYPGEEATEEDARHALTTARELQGVILKKLRDSETS